MMKPLDPAVLPEPVARFAEAEVAAGHYPSIEDVLCASVEALQHREQEWLDYARFRFQQGLEAEARGEAFRVAPRELMARIRERVEKAL